MAVSTNCSRELTRASGIFPAPRVGSSRMTAGIPGPGTDLDKTVNHLILLAFVREKAQNSPL
jgi:hypothetical protein